MCTLLHMQPLDDIPDSYEMMELAVLVDKYDCTVPLRYAISCLLDNVACKPIQWGSERSLNHMVTAAYVADQPVHFRNFTRDLVLHSAVRPDRFAERCLELLPCDLLGEN